MDFIIELVVWFAIEVVFWGIMFQTGYVLTKIATLGRWTPGRIEKDKDKRKASRKEPKFIVTALIGALFWFVVWIALVVVMKSA